MPEDVLFYFFKEEGVPALSTLLMYYLLKNEPDKFVTLFQLQSNTDTQYSCSESVDNILTEMQGIIKEEPYNRLKKKLSEELYPYNLTVVDLCIGSSAQNSSNLLSFKQTLVFVNTYK